uniref:WGS project CAEQ00000000 data, annotated contig 876 n=1 Tax=Trypanosoma congolense (strain IL3000) TaxID=1068625 RepID=F9WJ65_TRYCI|nr:unnamed protein product [Trypanosoma congolense IL3000]
MSFLVKTLLGDNVVHPVENSRKGSSPQGEEGNKEESDSFRAPVQKLISRVLSCTVPQDRRDALKELNEYPDLPSVMDPSEVLRICDLLRNYPEDGEVVESSLAILSNVTDVSGYPTSGPVMVSQGDKEYVRDSFLHTLVEQVPLLLGHMKEGSFWSRFHAVQLLQRLQDYDPLSMDKHLLASQGISVLVDILSDNSHGGALRNEGLVLIAAITATNTELQTLLAFNNAFEKLFEVIREEGDLDGGVIVADCLTIAHNMLRGNKATQKLFCEMDCAGLICPLMDAIAEPVRIAGRRCNNATHRTSEGSDALGPKVILTPLSGVQNMIALTAISLLGCVLRDGKALSDGGASVQESFLRCGVLSPLASLALLGAVVDDSVRVEALRTLAALVEDSELVVEQFLKLQVVTFLQEGSVQYVRETSAMRAALHVLLGTADRVLQPSVAQVFHALFTAADRGEEVALALLRGFSPPPSTAISVVTAKEPMTDDCGAAIAAALFSASTHNDCSGKYYAALLLDRLLMFPASSELLLEGRGTEVQSTSTARGSKCPTGADANDVTVQPDATFTAFVDYVLKCFRGQGEMDLNTLSACFRALLRWVVCDNKLDSIF